MASFGWTVLDRMMSEISRLRAISSLSIVSALHYIFTRAANLQARGRGSLDLLIQRRVGGKPPGHHLAGRMIALAVCAFLDYPLRYMALLCKADIRALRVVVVSVYRVINVLSEEYVYV